MPRNPGNSKLKSPVLRQSIIVDMNLASKVAFLSYLSGELSASSSFSLMVFDQARGLVDQTDPQWRPGVEKWKTENQDLINDPDICYLFAISGFIQKNIIRKKFEKYDGKLSAGAFGVNINGELSTGTDEYSMDVKFGLTPIVLKRPQSATSPLAGKSVSLAGKRAVKKVTGMNQSLKPSSTEVKLFSSIANLTLSRKKMFSTTKKPGAKKITKKGSK